MSESRSSVTRQRGGRWRSGRTAPIALGLLPLLTLCAYQFGGQQALVALAVAMPGAVLLALRFGALDGRMNVPRDAVTGLLLRDGFDRVMEQVHARTEAGDMASACFLIQIDDYAELSTRHGQAAADQIMARAADRIIGTLRAQDNVARVGDGRFAICLMPVRQLDLALCVQLAGRLQSALEEPVLVGGATLYATCSVGFCLRSRAPEGPAADWLDAAAIALSEACATGPSGIRAFSRDLKTRSEARDRLRGDAVEALEAGQIVAWFQPQLSTDTGRVTGFEALARWVHPVRGAIPPDQFLPALADAGKMERLGEVMMHQALSALKAWDAAAARVPRVSVNLSQPELNNPHLAQRVAWDLDRFDIAPDRLALEILETVVSDTPSDCVTGNLQALGALGCYLELDDYGTGHASIASIRRFPIRRIKIDRSFVMKADRDPEQQRFIGALLTMAERLEVETLAEGVETVGEHALLAQLGCDHVQGYGIGRPMPFDQTLDWLARHERKLEKAARIGRNTG
ncbi:MAG: bifunctional diguanylate cyclase/phosphodiesterase [Rhodobacteraceae bacterium]|nr:MAG: bifunctional diguanylate cyclase/phosphodiesterase [Paracoccaceae bacterium]